jgi:DNA helicase-2/ATP-dependent DNA helicase PcrA
LWPIPILYQQLIEGRQFDGEETERLRRQSVLRTEVLPSLADTVIREAKSSGILPTELAALAQRLERTLPGMWKITMCWQLPLVCMATTRRC